MSSAIQNLQRAISEGNQPLIQLLRQTKLIAAKLNLQDVETWVDHELKGYPPGVNPPPYRKYHTFQLQIHNPVRGWEFAGNVRMTLDARQPIAEIENLSNGQTSSMNMPRNLPVDDGLGGGIASRWPQRAII